MHSHPGGECRRCPGQGRERARPAERRVQGADGIRRREAQVRENVLAGHHGAAVAVAGQLLGLAQPADKAPPKGAIAQPEKVAERVAKAMATKAAKRDQAAA